MKNSDYTCVDAYAEGIATLQRDGWDLAKIELLQDQLHAEDEPDWRPVTPDEWKDWLDVIAAAPKMRAMLLDPASVVSEDDNFVTIVLTKKEYDSIPR